jgi:hypothetical protein
MENCDADHDMELEVFWNKPHPDMDLSKMNSCIAYTKAVKETKEKEDISEKEVP